MTRTAIGYTLSTLAAVALVSAFAGSPAFAEQQTSPPFGGIQNHIVYGQTDITVKNGDAPEGLTAKKGPQAGRPERVLRTIQLPAER